MGSVIECILGTSISRRSSMWPLCNAPSFADYHMYAAQIDRVPLKFMRFYPLIARNWRGEVNGGILNPRRVWFRNEEVVGRWYASTLQDPGYPPLRPFGPSCWATNPGLESSFKLRGRGGGSRRWAGLSLRGDNAFEFGPTRPSASGTTPAQPVQSAKLDQPTTTEPPPQMT